MQGSGGGEKSGESRKPVDGAKKKTCGFRRGKGELPGGSVSSLGKVGAGARERVRTTPPPSPGATTRTGRSTGSTELRARTRQRQSGGSFLCRRVEWMTETRRTGNRNGSPAGEGGGRVGERPPFLFPAHLCPRERRALFPLQPAAPGVATLQERQGRHYEQRDENKTSAGPILS